MTNPSIQNLTDEQIIRDYERQADELAQQYNITVPIDDQPRYFLSRVWSAMDDNELVGITVDDEYQKEGEYNKQGDFIPSHWEETLSSQGLFFAKIRLANYDFSDIKRRNLRTDYNLPDRGGVYWQLASRERSVLRRYNARGSKEELRNITTFCTEIDCLKEGYTLEQGLEALLKLPLPPSLVWFSGAGIHAAIILSDMWPLKDTEPVARGKTKADIYKAYGKALFSPLHNDNIKDDSKVIESTRNLRLPGFANKKASRFGAMSKIIYDNLNLVYTCADTQERVELPPEQPKKSITVPRTLKDNDSTIYPVTQMFIDLMVYDENIYDFIEEYYAKKGENLDRHHIMTLLACVIVNNNMPDQARDILRERAIEWYECDQGRANAPFGELDKIFEWAEKQDRNEYGFYFAKLTENGFIEVFPELEDEQDAIEEIIHQASLVINTNESDLQTIRDDFKARCWAYLNEPARHMALLAKLQTGVGKSHIVANVIKEWVDRLDAYEAENPPEPREEDKEPPTRHRINWFSNRKSFDKAEFAKLLDGDPDYIKEWVDRNVYEHLARTDDINVLNTPNERAYCIKTQEANNYAGAGYNTKFEVCSACPLFQDGQCEKRFYRSQVKAMRNQRIAIGRHENTNDEIMQHGTKINVYDEDPTNDTVAKKRTYTPRDLHVLIGRSGYENSNLPNSYVEGLENILEALYKGVKKGLPTPTKNDLIRDGYPLFNWLEKCLGLDVLDSSFAAIQEYMSDVKGLYRSNIKTDDIEITDIHGKKYVFPNFPPNHPFDLIEGLCDEYPLYKNGYTQWNSKIMFDGLKLIVYPMRPINTLPDRSWNFFLDATADPERYEKSFVSVSGKPFGILLYEQKIKSVANVIVNIRAENTMGSVSRKSKKRQVVDGIQYEYGDRIVIQNEAMKRFQNEVIRLTKEHNNLMLTITYKFILNYWKKTNWYEKNNLNPEHFDHFLSGDSSGSNKWQHFTYALIWGRPMPPPRAIVEEGAAWAALLDPLNYLDATPDTDIVSYIFKDGSESGAYFEDKHSFKDQRLKDLKRRKTQKPVYQSSSRVRQDTSFNNDGTPIIKTVDIRSGYPMGNDLKVNSLINITAIEERCIRAVEEYCSRIWEQENDRDIPQSEVVAYLNDENNGGFGRDKIQKCFACVMKNWIDEGIAESVLRRKQGRPPIILRKKMNPDTSH